MPTSVGELQGVSLIMSGDHNMYQKSKSYLDDFECPRCGHCCQSEVHMNTEAMQMALEALESDPISHAGLVNRKQAITALRQALETEQEPVAWANSFDLQNFDMKVRTCPDLHHTVPLYTAPPKRELTCVCGAVWEGETMVHSPREREWVGLTDEEVWEAIDDVLEGGGWLDVARALEQAFKEKNT